MSLYEVRRLEIRHSDASLPEMIPVESTLSDSVVSDESKQVITRVITDANGCTITHVSTSTNGGRNFSHTITGNGNIGEYMRNSVIINNYVHNSEVKDVNNDCCNSCCNSKRNYVIGCIRSIHNEIRNVCNRCSKYVIGCIRSIYNGISNVCNNICIRANNNNVRNNVIGRAINDVATNGPIGIVNDRDIHKAIVCCSMVACMCSCIQP